MWPMRLGADRGSVPHRLGTGPACREEHDLGQPRFRRRRFLRVRATPAGRSFEPPERPATADGARPQPATTLAQSAGTQAPRRRRSRRSFRLTTLTDGRRLAGGDEVIVPRPIHPPDRPKAWMRNGTTGRILAVRDGRTADDDRERGMTPVRGNRPDRADRPGQTALDGRDARRGAD
jgi:hypothetical protein